MPDFPVMEIKCGFPNCKYKSWTGINSDPFISGWGKKSLKEGMLDHYVRDHGVPQYIFVELEAENPQPKGDGE